MRRPRLAEGAPRQARTGRGPACELVVAPDTWRLGECPACRRPYAALRGARQGTEEGKPGPALHAHYGNRASVASLVAAVGPGGTAAAPGGVTPKLDAGDKG